jgi:Mechanosensitive ion channel
LKALHRYIALFAWSISIWITFNQLINSRQHADATQSSKDAVSFCAKLLFALMLCTAILLGEKVAIQAIATQFHERSYADRIEEQRRSTQILVTLYAHSIDQVGRSDTLHDNPDSKSSLVDPEKVLKNILRGVKGVAQTTTHAFGNIASEIVGSSVLQPNSPEAMVATALGSANKTRLLARRLFYSFRKPGAEVLIIGDIAPFFHGQDEATEAFAMFDKDSNGDATRDEMEIACMELHRERLALASSMRDIDSAVGRLDNILMSLYTVVVFIVFAVVLDSAVSTMLSGAAAFILALSWLIGASAQEILTSIIFLFIKHMYDVGDRVEIDGQLYTVKEIRLCVTILFIRV